MTLAATLTTEHVSNTIDQGDPGVFMHGPTFMANPLACAVSLASINLLLSTDWSANIERINKVLTTELTPCKDLDQVGQVRTLGAIGVVELKSPVDMKSITQQFVDAGVWIRPFGKLVYLMPPYITDNDDLNRLCAVIYDVVKKLPQ